MTDLSKDKILAAYDARFGRGWRAEVARALDMDTTLISRAKPPTLRVLAILIEWMEGVPEITWPARYDGLKAMSEEVRGGAEG